MKELKRTASVLRVIGWVLIGLAVAATIYTLANDGSAFNSLRARGVQADVHLNAWDRIVFDHQYFNALSDAAGTKALPQAERAASVRPYFSRYEAALQAAETAEKDRYTEEFYASFPQNFDAAAFLAFYEKLEGGEEDRLLREAVEYLDSVSKPAGKGGKLAKLQAASIEPDLRAFYETFAAEHGEEAGTYLEFMESAAAMIREQIAAGTAVTDARQFVKAMDYDAYQTALKAIQSQERAETQDLRDDFAALARQLAAGEKADVRAYYEGAYAQLRQKYPEETAPGRDVFVDTLTRLLNDAGFDGSLNALMKELRAANSADLEKGTAAFFDGYCQNILTVSDKSNAIGAVTILWFLAANFALLWLVAIFLLVLAKLLDKIVSRVTLNRLQNAGIEEEPDVLLRVNHLKQYFRSGDYINKAVDDVSFYIKKGEVFGLVGESGCGKTTTGRTIINLYDPTEGDVYFQGLRISSTQNGLPVLIRSLRNEYAETKRRMAAELKEKIEAEPQSKDALTEAHRAKLREMRRTLSKKISEARTNALESSVEKSKCIEKYREKRKAELTAEYENDIRGLSGAAAEARKARYEQDMKVAAKDNIMTKMQMIFQDPIASINPRMTVREIIAEGLKIRGIKDEKYIDEKVYEVLDLVGLVREHADRYPHEFSGGQRQRIGIARAIVLQPDLIIADEPISALDVSIQAQVINLLNDLRNKMGLTIMFIAHNLSVVKYFSDRIGVMYYGKLVELATADELFEHPLHPYTKSLLSAIPYPDPHHEKHRQRIEYNPHKAHDYSVDKPSLREVRPGHYVQCNDKEFAAYRRELGL